MESDRLSELTSDDTNKVRDALFESVYQELRQMAVAKLCREEPGQTLQPTALVHEVWLRLSRSFKPADVGRGEVEQRRYFFAAASLAMRRILIERARGAGCGYHRAIRISLEELVQPQRLRLESIVALHEALDHLQKQDPLAVEVVQLRFFTGLTMPEIAETMQLSLRSLERIWAYARSWLHQELCESET